MMSFISGTTGTAVNSEMSYPSEDASIRNASADSIVLVTADFEAESGVVEEVEGSRHEPREAGAGEPHGALTTGAPSESLEGKDASVLRPGSRGSSYDDTGMVDNAFVPPAEAERSGSRTPPAPKMASPPTLGRKQMATPTQAEPEVPGPRKTKVVVKECEYATYYAVLYYVRVQLEFCEHQPYSLRYSDSYIPT